MLHLAHPARDVISLQAKHRRQPGILGRQHGFDILARVGPKFLVPAGFVRAAGRGSGPDPTSRAPAPRSGGSGWNALRDRQLGDIEAGGMRTVFGALLGISLERRAW